MHLTIEHAQTDYIVAPWYQRYRWHLIGWFWHLVESFAEPEGASAAQANPLWHR